MVKLTKIYTKHGDSGMTALGSGERRPKHDIRISAIGTIDETNSFVGLARSKIDIELSNFDVGLTQKKVKIKNGNHSRTAITIQPEKLTSLDSSLMKIQNDLFDLGGDLTILDSQKNSDVEQLRILPSQVKGVRGRYR